MIENKSESSLAKFINRTEIKVVAGILLAFALAIVHFTPGISIGAQGITH